VLFNLAPLHGILSPRGFPNRAKAEWKDSPALVLRLYSWEAGSVHRSEDCED